jgi:hypothetical protein
VDRVTGGFAANHLLVEIETIGEEGKTPRFPIDTRLIESLTRPVECLTLPDESLTLPDEFLTSSLKIHRLPSRKLHAASETAGGASRKAHGMS